MPLIIAVWPNNTISVLRIWNGFTMLELYDELDREHDPLDATCYRAREDDDGLHISFDWMDLDPGSKAGPESVGLVLDSVAGRLKKLEWPSDIRKQWFRNMERSIRKSEASDLFRYLSDDENPRLPAPPPPCHTVDEIKKMKPFCGVYLAYDPDGSCHYVGESIKVPERVSSARPEIGDRLIGLVHCDIHQRRRIEAYYIGLLDPPGNAQSSHRLAKKGAKDGTPDR